MLTILAILAIASQATAHGFMNWPITRMLPGDQQSGYSFTRTAANRNNDIHPDPDINCAYLPKGPVFTQTMAPGPATVDYTITAHHNGGCIVMLSTDGQKSWKEIGRDPTCGIQAKNPTGRGSVQVTIPDGTYSAVLRWNWVADNGGAPNEIYNQCADIQVSPSGSNTHTKVEMMGGSTAAGFTALPRGSTFNSGCSQAGALKCAESNKAFINQCISIPAGGGYSGGINWYQYQCPNGATCQTSGGSDKCVGASGPVSPVPGPDPVPAPQPDQPPVDTPSPSVTPNKPVTTNAPAPTGAPQPPTTGQGCATEGALVMPIPSGSTCSDVKKKCQTFCLNSQFYNVERNQCFGETGNSATQWCKCNGVTYYNVASGTPTTQCPTGGQQPAPGPSKTKSTAAPAPPATSATKPNKSTQIPVATTAGNPTQGGVSNGAACSTNGGYACASNGAIAVCSGGAWVELSCPAGSKCGVMGGMTYCL
ncbi:hypothetical protein HDU78_005299 [Chytriomyces hyalinus]|nr:hypothetical protein HDU78_005299 [Chytriomyces hyalinus]